MGLHQKALVVGATGVVGKEVLLGLGNSEAYKEVVALTRRELPFIVENKVSNRVVEDFTHLRDAAESFEGVTDLFYCFGTTRRQAGGTKEFRKIEIEVARQVFECAKRAKVASVYLVSSLGADRLSRVSYNQVKGEIEEMAKRANFQRLEIFRPSILDGNREQFRPFEKIGLFFGWFLNWGPLQAYAPTSVANLAKKMIDFSVAKDRSGVFITSSMEI